MSAPTLTVEIDPANAELPKPVVRLHVAPELRESINCYFDERGEPDHIDMEHHVVAHLLLALSSIEAAQ